MRICTFRKCKETAKHSVLKNDGTWAYLCAPHYDLMAEKTKQAADRYPPEAILKFTRNNPGYL